MHNSERKRILPQYKVDACGRDHHLLFGLVLLIRPSSVTLSGFVLDIIDELVRGGVVLGLGPAGRMGMSVLGVSERRPSSVIMKMALIELSTPLHCSRRDRPR